MWGTELIVNIWVLSVVPITAQRSCSLFDFGNLGLVDAIISIVVVVSVLDVSRAASEMTQDHMKEVKPNANYSIMDARCK